VINLKEDETKEVLLSVFNSMSSDEQIIIANSIKNYNDKNTLILEETLILLKYIEKVTIIGLAFNEIKEILIKSNLLEGD
jgi:hypothetical protein